MTAQEKLGDIKNHPERHRHTFEKLIECCMADGAISLSLMDAHQKCVPQINRGCDVIFGHCGCGAWH